MKKDKNDPPVIGGISTPGRISMISDKRISTARWENVNGGRIINTVTRLPAKQVTGPLLRIRRLPVPRVVRLFLFLFLAGNWFIKLLLILFFTVDILAWAYAPVLEQAAMHEPPAGAPGLVYFLYAALLIWLTFFISRTRPWHGAEHMAIEAYRNTGSTALQDIKTFSPVSPHCGGRLVLPIFIASFAASPIAAWLDLPSSLIFLAIMELALWIDVLIGFQNIPVFSHASRLLQKWFTTKQPSKRELKTAKAALDGLVEAGTS